MVSLALPKSFSFKSHDVYEFEPILKWFDWTIANQNVQIDLRTCHSANYQALALLVLYAWHLIAQKCKVQIVFDREETDASRVWRLMGAPGWHNVLRETKQNFKGNPYKPLIALRNSSDFNQAVSRVTDYTKGFNVEYDKTLHYVVSELIYNTLEHGQKWYDKPAWRCPSILQFTWYKQRNEISFIVADLGIGIKRHLENHYSAFETNSEAIRYALKPQVSGTFGAVNPYSGKNNAGVGLYISSGIVQRLRADMFLVSGDGLVHVSPRDITEKTLKPSWPGTFVLVTIRLRRDEDPEKLQRMLSELREGASAEVASREKMEQGQRLVVSIENYFGIYAENKENAINFRDRRLLAAIEEGRSVLLDFANVVSTTHSFLSALLATPVKRLGMEAYRRIKITNALPEIRETIDYILDENTAN